MGTNFCAQRTLELTEAQLELHDWSPEGFKPSFLPRCRLKYVRWTRIDALVTLDALCQERIFFDRSGWTHQFGIEVIVRIHTVVANEWKCQHTRYRRKYELTTGKVWGLDNLLRIEIEHTEGQSVFRTVINAVHARETFHSIEPAPWDPPHLRNA